MKNILNFFGNTQPESQKIYKNKNNTDIDKKEINVIDDLNIKYDTNVDKILNTKDQNYIDENIIKKDIVVEKEEDINRIPLIRKILVTNSPNLYAKEFLKNNNLRDEYISICSRIGTLKLKKKKVESSGSFRAKGSSTLDDEILSLEKRKRKLSIKLEDLYKLTSRTSKYTKVTSSKIIDS